MKDDEEKDKFGDDEYGDEENEMNEDDDNMVDENDPDLRRFMEILRKMGGAFQAMDLNGPDPDLFGGFADGSDDEDDDEDGEHPSLELTECGEETDESGVVFRCFRTKMGPSGDMATVLRMIEQSLSLHLTGTGLTNGSLIVVGLVDDLMKLADQVLFGFTDNVYLGLMNRYGLVRTGMDFSFRFYWSTEGGILPLNLDVVWDFRENRELLLLMVGDLIEEIIDVGTQKSRE